LQPDRDKDHHWKSWEHKQIEHSETT
jgi:hypothetical protein